MSEEVFFIEDGVEVAPSAFLKPLRNKGCGSIQDLPDEELADPDELERVIWIEQFWPVFHLPVRGRKRPIKPNIDEDGRVDWGAFATADFERYKPDIDKFRYKADRLMEELKDLVIMVSIINDRIKSKVKYKVLKYVKMGIIDVDDIEDWDMWQLAVFFMRALRLKRQILSLREKSRQKKAERLQKWLDSLG
jgi:hypothetical protein